MREQAKALLQKPEDHVQGLNLINSTNGSYFQPQHQAEMINLKAQFFATLGDGDAGKVFALLPSQDCGVRQTLERGQASRCLSSIFTRPYSAANNMFSEALALWPLCWEAWMAWGKFCDAMYDKSKESQWLEFLATCYLQVQAGGLQLVFWVLLTVLYKIGWTTE